MSVKRLCDCCGKEIIKKDFTVLDLLLFSYTSCSRRFKQELCDSCAAEVYEHYRLMKANKQGKILKRVCFNCGYEDDNNPVCPVCKSKNWELKEE